MKKLALLLVILISFTSCSEKESNLIVSGEIKGLKKGTLYLQKIDDTSLVNIDSVIVDGDPMFSMETYIESPQIMYLYLEKVDNNTYDDRIDFFADKGEISINTKLEKFETSAKIVGSVNQEKLVEYRKMISRFNDQNLDLIKASFEAEKSQDEDKLMEIDKKYDGLLKRKYLYTVNFAINNKNHEIAPYLALSEVFDANIKYLDTIYNSLAPKVKKSKYGKELKSFLKERRKEEKLEAKVEAQSTEEN
ncbi:DUF4369 domain-containing protein [Christiangramia forsetii]|uniref:DUF4369 domain-containing protein n=2 Tax=Christiangramia forsetii TaxID=411153 RepID=A0M3X5_CHRFK|nr:DUF4369 domain-containing protein [Christiangramia forsetii]GGG24727.1 hypothetical protein GCM10011532_05070 [Christiangramia forsetii]CAL67320.1 conserved hypothetical protein [Christiangramia forsetii KT0803]